MRKLFVATHNPHKLAEIAAILPDWEVLADDPEGVEESAPDFTGNALIKVRSIAARHRGEWCMADDSGLEVAALGGAPGVFSARYSEAETPIPPEGMTRTALNNAKLLSALEGVADRRANFTCAIALVDPAGVERTVTGRSFGVIRTTPAGAEGFGYDPLFVPDGYDRSFAELTAAEKNAISHRARALAAAREVLG